MKERSYVALVYTSALAQMDDLKWSSSSSEVQMSIITMALKAAPLGASIRVLRTVSRKNAPLRQFACSAHRSKNVASHEEPPNMRHAQRPRKCSSFRK